MTSIRTGQREEQLVKALVKEKVRFRNQKVRFRNRNLTQEVAVISRAVLAADEAYLREAIESVHWERRGWLGRLVRVEPPAEQIERPTKSLDERLVA